jgi:UPF0755 protein
LNKKTAKTIGKVAVFCVTMIVLVLAGLVAYQFVKRAMSPGQEGAAIELGEVPGMDDVFIGSYLDANAEKLEQPAGTNDTPIVFVISPGETVTEIAARLQEEGLVLDAELFRRYVQYHGLDTTIEAGEFTLRQTMTIPEVAEALQRGSIAEQVVTVQEGLRLEQIAAAVAAQTAIPEDEFLSLVTTGWRNAELPYSFLADIPPGATLEGFLFPETYRLPEEATAEDLLSRMLGTFDERVTADIRAAAFERGMDVYDLVTMAAIVEREAVLEDERPLIAGVYLNRLSADWLLNADPTIQYAIASQSDWTGEWWPGLTPEDYQGVISSYNTYLNLGLPPSPICSPGLASIKATAYPTDTDFFYFMADCIKQDGSHLFAVDGEEHQRNYEMCGGVIP